MSDLRQLLSVAHDRTDHLPHDLSLRDFYLDAARHAEQHIPGDLGTALAGVLTMEAERLRAICWNSPLGQANTLLFLALTVLRLNPADPKTRALLAELSASEALRNARTPGPLDRP